MRGPRAGHAASYFPGMPFDYARRLTAAVRTKRENIHLGAGLAFVAGATNAGAFLAVHQYTSHMTGIVSAMAGAVIFGQRTVLITGIGALVAFTAGAATTAIMVNAARRRGLSSAYAQPLLLEAALLLLFGVVGARLNEVHAVFVPVTVGLLCYLMGLQNAVITKISHAVIRTTHVTGIITDLGIELGKLFYINRGTHAAGDRVVGDRDRLGVLTLLLVAFFGGGIVGAAGFHRLGYVATVPLAFVLVALAVVPVADDLRSATRRHG